MTPSKQPPAACFIDYLLVDLDTGQAKPPLVTAEGFYPVRLGHVLTFAVHRYLRSDRGFLRQLRSTARANLCTGRMVSGCVST